MANVTVYTQVGCRPCGELKMFLKANGIEFTTKDLTENPKYREEMEEMGAMSTPVTVIGDKVVLGFFNDAREEIAELLEL